MAAPLIALKSEDRGMFLYVSETEKKSVRSINRNSELLHIEK